MPASSETIIGVNEVGETDGSTDTSWGRTQETGATLTLSVTKQELFSGQAKMAEDNHINQVAMALQFSLIFAELQNLQRVLGIPSAQFTGDLDSPTAEELAIDQDSLGSDEKGVYAIGPGPASTRRVEALNAKLADVGDLSFSDTEWQLPEITWDVLNTADGTDVLTITDAT